MKTAETAKHLERVLCRFPMLAGWDACTLLGVVERELGHREILDRFCPYGNRLARAIAVRFLLHIVSGNVPHAALQSLVRGLLLGCHNFVKLPTSGLLEVEEFVHWLPCELASKVHLSSKLEKTWLEKADAVIVFGSDEAISTLRKTVPRNRIFLAHGTRVSIGIVFEDCTYTSVQHAAKDIFLYDQRGCLSPHTLFITPQLSSFDYAARLANTLQKFCTKEKCAPHSTFEAAGIFSERQYFRFLQTVRSNVHLWTSHNSSDWTVIHDPQPEFRVSPLGRTVFVKNLTEVTSSRVASLGNWIGTIGIWPAHEKYAEIVAQFGTSRICPLGQMQFPPADWHQDGLPVLSQLVHWTDFETELF